MVKLYRDIEISIEDNIGILTFNRPDRLNAMNRLMMDEIIEAIQMINATTTVKVGIIKGQGKAFMAGADIKEYGSQTLDEFKSFQERGKDLYSAIEHSSKPWIAAVNGYALGGGFEIALACDLILASETAEMGLPEVFLNLVPGGGGTQRLIQKIGINRVKEMLFTGDRYDARKLYDWGVVNRILDSAKFDQEVYQFAKKLTRRPPEALTQLKRLANLSLSLITFNEKIQEEGKTVYELFQNEAAQKAIQKFIHKKETK